MRGLCGWFSERAGDEGPRVLARMLASAHPRVDDAAITTAPGAALAAFGSVARPTVHENDGFVLLLAAILACAKAVSAVLTPGGSPRRCGRAGVKRCATSAATSRSRHGMRARVAG
jgi:hypothetical protein